MEWSVNPAQETNSKPKHYSSFYLRFDPYKQITAANAGYLWPLIIKGLKWSSLALKSKIQRQLYHWLLKTSVRLLTTQWGHLVDHKNQIWFLVTRFIWWWEIRFTHLDFSTLLKHVHAHLPFSLTYLLLLQYKYTCVTKWFPTLDEVLLRWTSGICP